MIEQTQDSDTQESGTGSITKMPPPMYAILAAGSQQPEPLRANSDEEAMATIRRRVRTGQVSTICLYKLVAAEVYEPSSSTVSPAEIQSGKNWNTR